ncbi:MAG: isopentenyl phosphate kinase [Aggregatilineales bacterium]
MVTFVKLGGSLITDKRTPNTFRADAAAQAARELSTALAKHPDLKLLIGHGSGSFGHVAAKKHGTIQGVRSREQWYGFAEVAAAAAELNGLMAKTLRDQGLPVLRFQPSASALCHDGELISMAVEPVRAALDNALLPLVYGDVALDEVRGGTIISTETIFLYLARRLPVKRILLLGEVEGVLDADGSLIPLITSENLHEVEQVLGGSAGTDVTGGMETKVREMVALARLLPGLHIRIISGLVSGNLEQVLQDPDVELGTLITA